MSTGVALTIGLMALLGFWAIGAHNRLVRMRTAVVQAWGPVDVQLGHRHALALELVALLGEPGAEAAMGDEVGRAALQTLQAAAQQAVAAAAHARARQAAAGAIQSLALAEQVLNGAMRPLPVLIKARGKLFGADELRGRAELLLRRQNDLHAQLVFVRRAFNETVKAYNHAVDEMPTCLLAGPMGFRASAAFRTHDAPTGPSTAPGPASTPAASAAPASPPAA